MLKNLSHSVFIMAAVTLPIFSWGDATFFSLGGRPALAQDTSSTDTIRFEVENFTEHTLQEFYISPSTDDYWGEDRLGERVLEREQKLEIVIDSSDSCFYDVLGVFDNGQEIVDPYVDLCINGGTYSYYGDNDRTLNVINQTSVELVEFYFTPASDDRWREDLLGEQVILPGSSADIPINSEECEYDFKAVFDDEDVIEQFNVNVCEGDGIVFSEGGQ
ncbi:hypothetical protein H6G89_08100 [Oscillatoria sp. FACHB-1407]|uniref:hypothetical protein n=1 Tax=Oscillatoria sp. FACHB-1407 TaxID=2692847 RepID=UPI001681ED88|nr:hypothetical protein [Oscillatoria sp. FACHB-1407]MBD2461004.1 hypothetical protein [Oscillatoria sp. FACHB-1407]